MAAAASVVITLDANTAKLAQGFKRSSQETRRLRRDVQRARESVNAFVKTAIAVYGVSKAFQAAESAARSFVTTAAQFEQFETTLKNIQGSADAASASMGWIQDFAATTPYQIEQVTGSFVKLQAYGLDPTHGLLRTLGDTASAMGKPIMQAVEAIADAVTGENERLKEFGIKARVIGDKIRYEWTSASGETRQVLIDNNRAIIQSTLSAIMNAKYAGAMKDQSATWNGMISNMQDSYTNFQKSVMDAGAFDHMKAALDEIKQQMEATFASQTPQQWSQVAVGGIDGVITALGVARDAMRFFEIGADFVKAAFYELVYSIDVAINGMIKAYNWISDANVALYDTAVAWAKVEEARRDYMTGIDAANRGDGQRWAEQTIADIHQTAEGYKHAAESTNEAKEKAAEYLTTIGATAQATDQATTSATDYYQAEIDTANAIMDGTAAIADANSALADNSSAWQDAASDVYDYADALEAAATTHSMLYDSHGNLQNSMMDKVNAQTHGVGTTVSLTDDQVMRINTFSPYTGYRGDVAKNQEEIRKKRSDADYQSLMEENRKKIDQENHTRQSRAREAERALEKIRREGEQARQKAEREAAKRIEESARREKKARDEMIRGLKDTVKYWEDAVKQATNTLQRMSDGLSTDWVAKGRETLYGGTSASKPLNEYFSASTEAWNRFVQDETNEDLLNAYNTRMTELIGKVSELNDTTKFESRAQQDWAKAQAMHQIRGYQAAQDTAKTIAGQQLEELRRITTANNLHKQLTFDVWDNKTATSLVNATGNVAGHAENIKKYTAGDLVSELSKSREALDGTDTGAFLKNVDDALNGTDGVKSNTSTTAGKHQSDKYYDREEWVKTGTRMVHYSDSETVFDTSGRPSTKTVDKYFPEDTYSVLSLKTPVSQFKSGGYTGDYGINEAVGIVHGREYVVNAASTKDLGLNGSQGLFQQMVTELRGLKRENEIMRTVLLEIAGTNGKIAYSERLRNYADGIEEVA